MIELYATGVRNANNRTYENTRALGPQAVGLGDLLMRVEVVSISAGGELRFAYQMLRGGAVLGSQSCVWTAPGKYVVGFGRGDLLATDSVYVRVEAVGTVRLSATLYSVAQGEGVDEWL